MSNTPRQPQPDDAVLGGHYQAPIDGAVLGGIEGLRQRLATDNIEVKKVALSQALNYGEKGVELLFEVLEKEKKDIQWLAYQLLENQNNSVIKARLNNYFSSYEFESITVNRRGEIIQQTPGKARYFQEYLDNGIYLDMTYIPGGTFWMGAPESEKDSDYYESPQHQVTIPPFWMGKYAVTQEQWEAIMGNNPSYFKGAKRPVERVSWNECQEFCQKLSQRTGKDYGLPSEAQWEYACRAGTTTPFHFGETITSYLVNYNCNYTYAKEKKGFYFTSTLEVGIFSPNAFGLYEMHGNVWEWCGDGWHDSYADKPETIKNNGDVIWPNSNGMTFVLRGGSWNYPPRNCRSASRLSLNFPVGFNYIGFRVVCRFSN